MTSVQCVVGDIFSGLHHGQRSQRAEKNFSLQTFVYFRQRSLHETWEKFHNNNESGSYRAILKYWAISYFSGVTLLYNCKCCNLIGYSLVISCDVFCDHMFDEQLCNLSEKYKKKVHFELKFVANSSSGIIKIWH